MPSKNSTVSIDVCFDCNNDGFYYIRNAYDLEYKEVEYCSCKHGQALLLGLKLQERKEMHIN